MSFVKTLATLAVGFAAARGYDKYKKMGGMPSVQDALRKAGEPGGMGDQVGQMFQKMGMPVDPATVRDMFGKFGAQGAEAAAAGQAGLDTLMASMSGAAAAGSKGLAEMMGNLTAGTPAGAAMEENARLLIRAMIQAAKADGEIDDEERKKILDQLGDASAEEIAFVEAELDGPVDVAGLAAATSETMKAQVYATSLAAIRPDTPAETTYLAQLAAALGLDAQTVARIHAGSGRD